VFTSAQGAARHLIDVVWLYCSPIPVGGRGYFTCSNDFYPLRWGEGKGGGQHPVVIILSSPFLCQAESNDWYRGPTELVQHFVCIGGDHIGARALQDIKLIWFQLFCSPIPVGRRGYFTCSNDFYLTWRRLEEGGGSAPCAAISYSTVRISLSRVAVALNSPKVFFLILLSS
jgi:hypothetical protein